ncbi:hypothetical protein COV15_03440 [Candidatus Woesearchaeota archaeon CG10_big_fil_rev_8_21_14_0_10_34_12]|nr:MAG: hypothetical protein COV15_03440 [Candidatus Woesearchaeota archaeon CG10_big_fil_rev_8_21_14_0_10_34_12]
MIQNQEEYFRYLHLLPKDSRGPYADNPERFRHWFDGDGINIWQWPQIILAQDLEGRDSFTWHWVCDDYDYMVWLGKDGPSFINERISRRRKRNLKSIEIISRTKVPSEFKHYFLEGEKFNPEDYSLISFPQESGVSV